MTRDFHRWEVDPFFTAAEEVQDSADRLELVYRTWVHAKSVDLGGHESISLEHRRRELSTALGTAKWQIEEFARAVSSLDVDEQEGAVDDAPARHKHFVDALQNQINLIEMSLLNSGDSRDLKALPVVHLGQEEKDDLVVFLCGSKSNEDLKKRVFCGSSTLSDGKKDEELTSESVKSSNEVSECFSTSASNSEKALSKVDAKRSDVCCSPQARGFVNERAMETSSLEVCIVQHKKSFYEPVSEHVHVGGGEISSRVGNGHLRTGSAGNGFSTWKSGSADGEEKDSTSVSKFTKFWPRFSKKLCVFNKRFSDSGLKRWKDGDLNSTDRSFMLQLMHEPTDLETGSESSYSGGTFIRSSGDAPSGISGNSLHPEHWSEGLKLLLSFMYAFPTSRFVHKASAILVTSGFAVNDRAS